MPSGTPDAVDRLKKGIKGLFNKNKKAKDSESSKSAGESSKGQTRKLSATQPEASTAVGAGPPTDDKPAFLSAEESLKQGDAEKETAESAGVTDPATATATTEGETSSLAQAVEAAAASEPANPEDAGTAVKEQAAHDVVGSMPPEVKPREPAEGMSATSGPLQDDPEFAHAIQ
ncbi:MAG: hypothetical protein M1821_003952 [Bathelium mastoideum]|nr:MAG: hypothetical protein M1821_003952 [Bathelium mastoideum]KAI9691026.1 MAG: hypothetical protein M1822_008646 [Bathelium mastoideum]